MDLGGKSENDNLKAKTVSRETLLERKIT